MQIDDKVTTRLRDYAGEVGNVVRLARRNAGICAEVQFPSGLLKWTNTHMFDPVRMLDERSKQDRDRDSMALCSLLTAAIESLRPLSEQLHNVYESVDSSPGSVDRLIVELGHTLNRVATQVSGIGSHAE